ncbi:MAG: sigma-70 family RNA polymerase sigma factor [Acidobacteriota bacterium]
MTARETAEAQEASQRSDAELVAALKASDETAYAECLQRFGGRMLAVARRFMRDEGLAQDVVQEAFLNAFKAIDRFDGRAKLSTWLHRITVNTALMKLRHARSRPEASIEDMLPTFDETGHRVDAGPPWSAPDDVAARFDRNELRKRVRMAIDRLPDTHRTVLLLRDIEELSGAETADVLGITTNAVKVRLHRARQALREQLDPDLRGPVP